MTPRALVVTTVHWPDDTRIRERLIRSLAGDFQVIYATKRPGPTDRGDLRWAVLRGGRVSRWFRALSLVLASDWDALILHDPETIPIGILARLLRRRPVVFDVHEDIPATALTRPWVPGPLRRPLARLSRLVLRFAEGVMTITLAEPGYRQLFARDHEVFPNYPDTSRYPDPETEARREVVHLGDVTPVRGVDIAVMAAGRSGLPLRLIGRAAPDTRRSLEALAADCGAELIFEGAMPNPEALAAVAGAAVAVIPWKDLPNYRQSLPTKLLEYLALGVPTVASDLPGIAEAASGLEGVVLVPPGDPDELASGIEQALAAGFRQKAAAAAPRIRSDFSWPGEEVRRFYLGLVAREGSQSPN